MNLVNDLLIFMTALFSALIMVPVLRRWALERGELDTPDARKVHSQPIPRLGGIAIFMAALFSSLLYMKMGSQVRGVLAGALVMFFTGLVDDLQGLSPKRKFFGEIAACLITISVGKLYIHRLGDLVGAGPISLPLWLAVPFTVFAVVGVINAVNLIDGLDGLAGGISVIALAGFSLLALQGGNPAVLALCAALLGALLGFLKYNFYPARIFMGDTGSLVIGFFLAFLAIFLTQTPGSTTSPMVPVIILGLPIIDTVWVMTRRMLQGASPFMPDRTHVHHKFLDLGLQHRFTVIFIYGISLFWTLFSLAFRQRSEAFLLWTYLLLTLGFYLVLRYVLRHRERFSFLALDSHKGLRESVTYERLAQKIGFVVPCLTAIVLFYLGLSVVADSSAAGNLWPMAGILAVGGGGTLYLTRDPRNRISLALLYLAGLVITFAVETGGRHFLVFGMPFHRLSNAIFVVIALLIGIKTFFRRDGEFFLATVDLLLLGTSIVLAALFFEVPSLNFLSSPLLKGIVLFLAVKVVATEGKKQAGMMAFMILAATFFFSLRGFLG